MTSVSVSLTVLTIDEELVKSIVDDCKDVQHREYNGIKTTLFDWYDIRGGDLECENKLDEAKIPYEKIVDGCSEWSEYIETAKLTPSFETTYDNYVATTENMVLIPDVQKHLKNGNLEQFLQQQSDRYVFDWAIQEKLRTALLSAKN